MSFDLYEAAIPYLKESIKSTQHIFKEGEEYGKSKGISEEELINARLAPDMFPLSFQAFMVSSLGRLVLTKIADVNFSDELDRNSDTTFEAIQKRLAETLESLEKVDRKKFDGKAEIEVIIPIPGRDLKFTATGAVHGFVIPNLFFHTVTAYSILRSKGVPLGKKDFLTPYMGASY